MGMFNFGIREGTWWLHSDKDSRWNTSGRAAGTISFFRTHAELAIEEMKKDLGEPPDDLKFGCMKD